MSVEATGAPAAAEEEHFLSGEKELEYAGQQLWGSYWTGARLLVAGWLMAFGSFLFAFFYLRASNSSGLWYVRHQRPSLMLGVAVLVLFLASAVLNSVGAMRLRQQAASMDWLVSTGVAFLVGAIATGLQVWDLARLPFNPGRSGYASVFVGWQAMMIVAFLGGLYWMETLLARGIRVRRLLRPLAFTVRDEDVIMFRGSLDGFGLYWNFLAGVEIVVFILFYVVH